MRSHGGARRGAGRPRKESPLACLRVLRDPHADETEMTRAAQRLMDFRWTRETRHAFRRSSGADYVQGREDVIGKLWDALLTGLPKMAERGDVTRAWFAYRMITRTKYGVLRPRSEVLAKLRELAPQAARALWRISTTNDPKGPYKSTVFLKIRRQARSALCREIGIPTTRKLIQVQGRDFARLLLEAIAKARPTLTPEQAVVLAAWADRPQAIEFLKRGVERGIFKIREPKARRRWPVREAQ